MWIFAYSNSSYEESFYKGTSLQEIVSEIQSDDNDPEDYSFFEVDPSTAFQVEMKAVRKEVPVRISKAK